MLIVRQAPVIQRIALLSDNTGQICSVRICIVGRRTVSGAEKGSRIGCHKTVNIVCIRFRDQVINKERTAQMYEEGIPFESPVGIVGSKTPDISDFVQSLPVLTDGHQPGHAPFHIRFIEDGSFGQIIVRDSVALIGNDKRYGACVGNVLIYPFVGQPAAHHTFLGRL